ncbi:hypothetical protein BC828DRAFT_401986 [Blastocladiella britannica]|nr:hypothetical protein BC828DRAFT_401986 [Blastocladiella britannica]
MRHLAVAPCFCRVIFCSCRIEPAEKDLIKDDKTFRWCVRLTRNMRFKDDDAWGDVLARGRIGLWDQELYSDLQAPEIGSRPYSLSALVYLAVVKVGKVVLPLSEVIRLQDIPDSQPVGAPIAQRFFVGMRHGWTLFNADGRMYRPNGRPRNVYVMLDHPLSIVPYNGGGCPNRAGPLQLPGTRESPLSVDMSDPANRVLRTTTTKPSESAAAIMVQFPLVRVRHDRARRARRARMTLDAITITNPVATASADASSMTITDTKRARH